MCGCGLKLISCNSIIEMNLLEILLKVGDSPYSRLCSNKSILTVNGKFPGPTIRVTEGDTIAIVVVNRAKENVTIHW